MRRKTVAILFLLVCLITLSNQGCIHDHFTSNVSFHYYDDLTDTHRTNNKTKVGRILQTLTTDTTNLAASTTTSTNGK